MMQWRYQVIAVQRCQHGDLEKRKKLNRILGGMMSYAFSASSNITRRAFRALIAAWALMFMTGLALVIVFGTTKAQASDILPFPKVAREIAAPEYIAFSQVPSPSVAADRCQSLLTTVRQDTRSDATASPRRPAGQFAAMEKVKAIKAYRHCKNQTTLQQLATWP